MPDKNTFSMDSALNSGQGERTAQWRRLVTGTILFILILLTLVILFFFDMSRAMAVASGLWLSLLGYLFAKTLRHRLETVTIGSNHVEAFPQRLARMLNAISEPIIILDARSIVVFANNAARARLPNCKENNPLSFGLRDPVVLEAVDKVLRTGTASTVQYNETIPIERFYELSMASVAAQATHEIEAPESDGSERASMIILMRDVTRLQRVENMRVDFVANASHELRTPLASVIGFIETLQGPARSDPKAREKFLDIMGEQARRMSRLVDDLLSLSRIELTQHVQPSDRVDIVAVVRLIVDTLSGLARERKVEIKVDVVGNYPYFVLGDRDEMLRVFENLIENAIKYGQTGGKVHVAIAQAQVSEDGQPQVEITVRDFGPGIAPEHLPRLTERFYRVDVGTSREQGGTGLGLAIVKHIVTRHGGTMRIESWPNEGAKFTIKLKLIDQL